MEAFPPLFIFAPQDQNIFLSRKCKYDLYLNVSRPMRRTIHTETRRYYDTLIKFHKYVITYKISQ